MYRIKQINWYSNIEIVIMNFRKINQEKIYKIKIHNKMLPPVRLNIGKEIKLRFIYRKDEKQKNYLKYNWNINKNLISLTNISQKEIRNKKNYYQRNDNNNRIKSLFSWKNKQQ